MTSRTITTRKYRVFAMSPESAITRANEFAVIDNVGIVQEVKSVRHAPKDAGVYIVTFNVAVYE